MKTIQQAVGPFGTVDLNALTLPLALVMPTHLPWNQSKQISQQIMNLNKQSCGSGLRLTGSDTQETRKNVNKSKQRKIDTDNEKYRQRGTNTLRQTDSESLRQTDNETLRQTDNETQRQADTQTKRQTIDSQTDTHRDRKEKGREYENSTLEE